MTLVLDASVLVECLAGSEIGEDAFVYLLEHAGDVHIPHLAVVETASALRAWARRGKIDDQRAEAGLVDLDDFPAGRWPAEPLLPRIWELRHNLTAYDATYVALAEGLRADLLTADHRLARAAVDAKAACRVVAIHQ